MKSITERLPPSATTVSSFLPASTEFTGSVLGAETIKNLAPVVEVGRGNPIGGNSANQGTVTGK